MSTFMEKVRFGLTDPLGAARHVIRKRHHPWEKRAGFMQRQYGSYDEYLAHQREKLDSNPEGWLDDFDKKYRAVLRNRLHDSGSLAPGARVLCLAARFGTEVKAFLDLGCFAVGIDLNPGRNNHFVITGDFHHLQFAADSVDIVFCNALDHAFDLPKLIGEVRRVLVPSGAVILEIVNGREEGYVPGYYEAAIWNRIDDVLAYWQQADFEVAWRVRIEYPWAGEMVVLRQA